MTNTCYSLTLFNGNVGLVKLSQGSITGKMDITVREVKAMIFLLN